jgi:hypothetical protein
VSVLDETWVKATCFSKKAKKFEVIKEISHLVGGPVEVDDKLLKAEGIIRVKVLCKDAIKINCSTLLYINGQGRLLNVTVHPKIVLSCKPDTNNHKRVREREKERESDNRKSIEHMCMRYLPTWLLEASRGGWLMPFLILSAPYYLHLVRSYHSSN